MSAEDRYRALVPVIVDLFENSDVITSVEIPDPPIKVTGNDYRQIIGVGHQQPNQVVQIINSIQTSIKIENKVVIEQIIENLKRKGVDSNLVKEAKEKLIRLSNEVEKPKPRWNVIKKIILWTLDFGKDIFIQLIPLLIKMKL